MRYRLRTLLIVLALGPPVLAWLLQELPDTLISESLTSHDRRLERLLIAEEANARQRPLGK